jgi:hypothetical protein
VEKQQILQPVVFRKLHSSQVFEKSTGYPKTNAWYYGQVCQFVFDIIYILYSVGYSTEEFAETVSS